MSFRRILKYPDSRLRQRSLPVGNDDDVKDLVGDLFDTLNVSGGVGLSAPQIGVHKRVIFVSCEQFTGEMINPIIKETNGTSKLSEGCLSFPGVSEDIKRSDDIIVEYTKLSGEKVTEKFTGLPAQVVQHEVDHLNGVLMIDSLSRLKRSKVLKRVRKVKKGVYDMLNNSLEKTPKRIKSESHLSRKEVKKRKARRKQNRR